jgi:hypothetical protein
MNPHPVTSAGRRQFLCHLAGSPLIAAHAAATLHFAAEPLLHAADRAPRTEAADQPIPVVDEPSHRKVFENAFLRVLDVQLAPGATSLFHWHVAPSVIIYLTPSTNRAETWPKREIITRELTPGQSRYAPYDEKPLAHRVTNTGAGLFRVFDIELLQRPAAPAPLSPLPAAHVKLQWEERLARGAGIVLAVGEHAVFPASPAARFLVVTAGTLEATATDPRRPSRLGWGEFRFFPAQTGLKLHPAGPARAEAVLLEVKT